MAFSKSIQEGQFPKCCDLCESNKNWKCVNCNLLMCTNCKNKVHSKIKSADKHKIIGIEDVGKYTEDLDFSHIYCEDHKGQICCMFCTSCDQLVCPRCISQMHIRHGLVEISEAYEVEVEILQEDIRKQKSDTYELINAESNIKLLRNAEYAKYTETRDLIKTQNTALKMAVDEYTEKLVKKLEQKWETLQNTMDAKELEVTALKRSKEDQNTMVEDIISSNDVDKVFKHSKIAKNAKKEYTEPLKLEFTPMPKFLPGEITEYNVGLLHDLPNDLVINILQQFTTDINKVYFLSTCPDNSLWISDQNILQRVIPEGSNLKVMSNFNLKIYGMTLTPSNDLLLNTDEPSRLKQISGNSGQITDSVFNVEPLTLTAVHVTSDYEVIVGARGSDKNVVIRMNKEGKHEKTYEHDRNKQPIFTYVRYITGTTNGTISVVDELSEDAIACGNNSI